VKWSSEAEAAVSKVPFFVRSRVRKKVEEEANRQGTSTVTLDHVTLCRNRFLKDMDSEVKGYQVEVCFGSGGCPNRVVPSAGLVTRLEQLFSAHNLRAFLKDRVQGPLKLHHEFRVSVAECPNACSRPQIVDVGIIGAGEPALSEEPCTRCGACVAACAENAVSLDESAELPTIDPARCVMCGQCVKACPTGALRARKEGFRILVGGKLGRHPQLGKELPAIFSEDEVVAVVEQCIRIYKENNRKGERFGEILNRIGYDCLTR
jgi:anaerobic sulfite reductase subunit C